jgi:hypothetical protein
MKKITLKIVLTIAITVITGVTFGQDNVISLKPTNNGSEANTRFLDEATLSINASGAISYIADGTTNNDWTIESTGVVTLSGAQNQTFKINWKGAGSVDTNSGADFGALLTQAGVDRASNGDLGIRGGTGNGIDPNEGYIFGFDATNFSSDVTIKVTEISFSGMTASTGEEATIVNRLDTSKTLVTQVDGVNDISGLEIYITGGEAKLNIMSVFHSGNPNAFRINGITFEIRDTATLSTETINNEFANFFKLDQNPVSDVISINYNPNNIQEFTASLVDLNGRIIQTKKSDSSINANNISFNSNTLSSGLYFVKISNGNRNTIKRVIKK